MRIAILNDSHFGLRNSSDVFIDYTEKFFRDVFFPYCDKNGIKDIIHLGDFYDHRKFVNYKVLHRSRKMLLEPAAERGIKMMIIPGNHDVYFRNTNELCGLREVLGYYKDNVYICMNPLVANMDGLDIGFLPWVTVDNYAKSLDFINTCKAPVLMSHLELKGFEMMKGMPVAAHGMDATMFARFEMVLSGHYHTKSSKDNIHYLGTQYEQTWADADDPKFFHVLDTQTRELTAIQNTNSIFNRFVYNDTIYDKPQDVIDKCKFDRAAGSFVKVIVAKKTDPFVFDKYVDRMQQAGPFELKIVESFEEFSGEAVQDDHLSLEDTGKLLNTYIEAVETDLDKARLKTLIQELYVEAQSQDTI